MESLADDKAESKYGKEAFCIGFNVGAGSVLAPHFVTSYVKGKLTLLCKLPLVAVMLFMSSILIFPIISIVVCALLYPSITTFLFMFPLFPTH